MCLTKKPSLALLGLLLLVVVMVAMPGNQASSTQVTLWFDSVKHGHFYTLGELGSTIDIPSISMIDWLVYVWKSFFISCVLEWVAIDFPGQPSTTTNANVRLWMHNKQGPMITTLAHKNPFFLHMKFCSHFAHTHTHSNSHTLFPFPEEEFISRNSVAVFFGSGFLARK